MYPPPIPSHKSGGMFGCLGTYTIICRSGVRWVFRHLFRGACKQEPGLLGWALALARLTEAYLNVAGDFKRLRTAASGLQVAYKSYMWVIS